LRPTTALYVAVKAMDNSYTRARPMQYSPITQMKCQSCGSTNTRPHRDGDFIFCAVEEKCPNCGAASQIIIGIYVEDQKTARGVRSA